MKYLGLFRIPFELVLITLLTFIVSVVLSTYLIFCIIFDLIRKGYKNGLRRSIT